MAAISVVIPAYNAAQTIEETIHSVQNQTFSDFEIIVVNDGSTDNTWDIINQFDDPRIKAFSYDNAGVSVTRNRGIAHASGEFIAFLDADDLWTPDKLASQLQAINSSPNVAVAYSWTSYFHEIGEMVYPGNPVYGEGNVYPEMLQWNFIASGSNILVRRHAVEDVGGFDPDLPPCEDWDFYLRLAEKYQFALVPKHQIIYRQSSTSATASKLERLESQCFKVIEKSYARAPEEYQYLKSRSLAWAYEYFTQMHLQNSKDITGTNLAAEKFFKAVRLYPPILFGGYGRALAIWLAKRYILAFVPLKRAAS